MNPFEKSLSLVLDDQGKAKKYLAAVSGGADSTAMLCSLAALRKDMGFTLHCVHVEHGIRTPEESRGDAYFVKALCREMAIPCRIVFIPHGKIATHAKNHRLGIEAAARHFRYKILHRERKRLNADWILTAHTKNDVLENILIRILRGSGPGGLSPIRQTRGHIFRPLLETSRQDILNYLNTKGISYRTDSTNENIDHLRNRVRLKLIPLLDEYFPSWKVSLLEMAKTQSFIAAFLEDEVNKKLSWSRSSLPGGEPCLKLSEEDFFNAPPILREEAIFAGFNILKPSRIPGRAAIRQAVSDKHTAGDPAIRQAVSANAASGNASRVTDLGRLKIERKDGFIYLKPYSINAYERDFSMLIKEGGFYTLKGELWGDKNFRVNFHGHDRQSQKPAHGSLNPVHVERSAEPCFSAAIPMVLRKLHEGDRILLGGHKRRFSDIIKAEASGVRANGARAGAAEAAICITALDKDGVAAFIYRCKAGKMKVLQRDNRVYVENDEYLFFEVTGN